MSDIPADIMKAANECVAEFRWNNDNRWHLFVARALLAEREQGGFKPKPLEWVREPDELPRAESAFGTYVMWPHYWHVELGIGRGMTIAALRRIQLDRGATEEQLEIAAQEDHDARVRSAILSPSVKAET